MSTSVQRIAGLVTAVSLLTAVIVTALAFIGRPDDTAFFTLFCIVAGLFWIAIIGGIIASLAGGSARVAPPAYDTTLTLTPTEDGRLTVALSVHKVRESGFWSNTPMDTTWDYDLHSPQRPADASEN